MRVADYFLSSTRVELSKSVLKTGIGQSVVEYWMAEVSRALLPNTLLIFFGEKLVLTCLCLNLIQGQVGIPGFPRRIYSWELVLKPYQWTVCPFRDSPPDIKFPSFNIFVSDV